MTNLTRRQALAASAALPVAALGAGTAHAAAEMKGPSMANHRRFKLGDFEVTTLLVGTMPRDEIQTIFGMNVSPQEFAQVSKENFIPDDVAQFFFTPTIVNTGSELILFDTGLNAEGTGAALAEAGYSPDQVDKVVITHMHGDHIGGLLTDGAPTFANAAYYTGAVEFDHWAAAENERFEQNVRPLADQFAFLEDGGEVASGITAAAAFGHTPGHMTYMLDSGDKQLLLIADLANHPVWSLGYPDWEVRFDMDKEGAAASRRRVLGKLATERMPFIGYHMPFPAVGFVETRSDGFRYVPAGYQMML
ncbi:MAG: MBL fold metallo-hydrolase [Rhodobacteraceae bacterium]|nr:MBL fold metallo-hydrolase [Paracoccaceae bacterium]